MNDVLRSPAMASTIATAYEKDGYFFPYDVISESRGGRAARRPRSRGGRIRGRSRQTLDVAQLSVPTAAFVRQADPSPAADRGRVADHRPRSAGMELRVLHQGAELEELRELASGPQLLGPRRGPGGHGLATPSRRRRSKTAACASCPAATARKSCRTSTRSRKTTCLRAVRRLRSRSTKRAR